MPESIIVALITAIGAVLVAIMGVLAHKVSVSVEKQTKQAEKDSVRLAKIGKLRAQREQILDEYRDEVDDYAIQLGSAYCRGNDKELVSQRVLAIKDKRKNSKKTAEQISAEIVMIYEQDEQDRNR